MAEVAFLPEALADYQDAYDWYLARSLRAAAGFEAAVDVALTAIAANPERWPSFDERHRFYIPRRYPYNLIYRLVPEGVLIVAVAHQKRSPNYWRDRG